jgi:hypothetical protein
MPLPALKRRRVADIAATGGFSMNQRQSLLMPKTSFDSFLFARVSEEANGMQLSVISALARMNVDPWEEASKLAAMPKAAAENAVASILDMIRGRSSNHSENTATAARLVLLLPQPGDAATAASGVANGTAPRTGTWWVWVWFALAMTFITAHQQKPASMSPRMTTSNAMTAPNVKAVAPVKPTAVAPVNANAIAPTVPLSR